MASFTGSYDTINHGDYTEYVVSSGSRLLVVLEEGDRLENIHFNYSASGAYVNVVATPSWQGTPPNRFTLRNIAFTGGYPSSDDGFVMVISCRDEALVENIYLGDGASAYPVSGGWNNYGGGMGANPTHTGHLTVREVYVSNFIDNGMYFSPPGTPGPSRGTFELENCYSVRNQISCIRLGVDDVVRNCYTETNNLDHRGLWVYTGATVNVHDSRFNDRGAINNSVVVNSGGVMIPHGDTRWNTSSGNIQGSSAGTPSEFIPGGVPLTPEDAYLGTSGSDPRDPSDPEPTPGEPDFATGDANNRTPESVRLNARLDDMANHDELDCRFVLRRR